MQFGKKIRDFVSEHPTLEVRFRAGPADSVLIEVMDSERKAARLVALKEFNASNLDLIEMDFDRVVQLFS